ncbi:hypothetical protein QCA50_013073 [Cerrena zonata]|uniref:Uncharacterized protein n=1 Tax=Cerrena zonata TaxID=2478898 RepID=A0AAW0G2A8_9APHY
MGTVCLSNAPILRCQSLTRLESGILLIPTALELIFSIALLFAKKSGRKHFLLSAEGVFFFILAGVDVLAHVLPGPRRSLATFKGLDIFIGALSFVPLVMYTLYLYLLTTKDVLPGFPQRLQVLSKYILFGFIPLIVIMNQLASFIGISYHLLRNNSIAFGFTNADVRVFLNAFLLILLVLFQALNFGASFFRLMKAFMNQRRIDNTQRTEDEVHLFNGLGWITVGIKLGAIESIIGFVDASFGLAMTRRILKLLGRACLIIGVVKGVDMVEDFQFVKTPKPQTQQRRSMLRALIANPRYSTFQQIGGHDFNGAGANAPRPADVVPAEIRAARITPSVVIAPTSRITANTISSLQGIPPRPPHALAAPRSMSKLRPQTDATFATASTSVQPPFTGTTAVTEYLSPNARSSFPALVAAGVHSPMPSTPEPVFAPQQRVTVSISRDRRPTLYLRPLSDLDVPDHMTSAHSLSDMISPSKQGFHRPTKSLPTMTSPSATFGISPPVPVLSPPHGADKRSMRYTMSAEFRNGARQSSVILPRDSMISAYSTDSIDVVRKLASQFPGIPPRKIATKGSRPPTLPMQSPDERDEMDGATIHEIALDRGPSVGSSRSGRSVGSQSTKGGSLVRRSSSVKRKPVPRARAMSMSEDGSDEATLVMHSAPVSRSNSLKDDQALPSIQTIPMPPIPATPESELAAFDAMNPPVPRPRTAPGNMTAFPSWQRSKHARQGTLEFPWVARPGDVADEGEAVLAEARQSVAQLTRVKSVGSVPKMTTPPITQNSFYRESVVAEWHDIAEEVRKKKLSEISELLAKRASASAGMALSMGDRYRERDVELGATSFLDYR